MNPSDLLYSAQNICTHIKPKTSTILFIYIISLLHFIDKIAHNCKLDPPSISSGSIQSLSMATVTVLRRAQLLITKSTFASHRITRAMSSMLVEDPKYSWLKDLGLGTTNKGAFYGVWGGSGEV